MPIKPIEIQTLLAKTADIAKREAMLKNEMLVNQENKAAEIDKKHKINDNSVNELQQTNNSEKRVKERKREGREKKQRQNKPDDGKGRYLDIEA